MNLKFKTILLFCMILLGTSIVSATINKSDTGDISVNGTTTTNGMTLVNAGYTKLGVGTGTTIYNNVIKFDGTNGINATETSAGNFISNKSFGGLMASGTAVYYFNHSSTLVATEACELTLLGSTGIYLVGFGTRQGTSAVNYSGSTDVGGSKNFVSNVTITNNWQKFLITWNSTQMRVYKDNLTNPIYNDTKDYSASFYGFGYRPTQGGICYFDNVYICNGIEDCSLYVDNINISTIYPTTGTAFINASISFNTTITATNNFNVSLYINSTLNETKTYTAGTNVPINFTKNMSKGSYSYYFYAVESSNTTQNENSATSLFTLDTNSINITIRDETTNALITSNISVRFYSSTYGEWTNYTDSSNLYVQNLNTGEYQLLFTAMNTSLGYSPRTYTITISNTSAQFLTAYMPLNTSTTLFTITDQDTAGLLENVLMTMYRNINSSWVPVESKYSDITGKIQFSYIASGNYKFYLAKTGYIDYVFYLNPILFSSYDVSMTRTSIQNLFQDYDGISVLFAPTSFNAGLNNFTFIIQSPYGTLTNYGYNLTYPSSSNSSSGSNAIGSQLNSMLNITPTSILDTVNLTYYYTSTLYGLRTFSRTYPISFNSSTYVNNTMISNQNETYGLGIFERVLLCNLLLIFVVGMASMVGQAIPGMLFGLLLFGFFVYIGFLPLWTVLLTVTIGFLLIVRRT